MRNVLDEKADGVGARLSVDEAVVSLLRNHPGRVFDALEVIDATGHPTMEVLIALSRLTTAGRIERPEPARYRWTGAPATQTAATMRAAVFGEK